MKETEAEIEDFRDFWSNKIGKGDIIQITDYNRMGIRSGSLQSKPFQKRVVRVRQLQQGYVSRDPIPGFCSR